MSKKKTKKQKIILSTKIIFISLFLFVLSFLISFALLVSFSNQKMVDIVKTSNFINPITSKVYDINGKLITEFFRKTERQFLYQKFPHTSSVLLLLLKILTSIIIME